MQQLGCSCLATFQLLDTQVMQQQQLGCGFFSTNRVQVDDATTGLQYNI